jgi:hypothetical protein
MSNKRQLRHRIGKEKPNAKKLLEYSTVSVHTLPFCTVLPEMRRGTFLSEWEGISLTVDRVCAEYFNRPLKEIN